MKIALIGYGKMGKVIEKIAQLNGHQIVYKSTSTQKEGKLSEADVAIEFSTPETAFDNIKEALNAKIPVVCGTTGWLGRYDEIVNHCKENDGSFIYASNFSVGVNLFFVINTFAARLMGKWKEYDVSVEEIHHTQKKDAPSGTAITLSEEILNYSQKKNWVLNKQESDKLTITAVREEDVKGTHVISYNSEIDSIHLEHKAHSRDGFAKGALLAAAWLKDKKGIFSMKDVLGIDSE